MRARLVVVLLASGLAPFLVGVEPASACLCVPSSAEAAFAQSDAVFRGEVIAYEERDPLPSAKEIVDFEGRKVGLDDEGRMLPQLNVWTFSVERVFKGKLEPVTQVVGTWGTCNLELPRTGRFLIYAGNLVQPLEDLPDVHLIAGLCGGSRVVPAPYGKGSVSRGGETEIPQARRTTFADRVAPWLPVAAVAGLMAVGTGILTYRRRQPQP